MKKKDFKKLLSSIDEVRKVKSPTTRYECPFCFKRFNSYWDYTECFDRCEKKESEWKLIQGDVNNLYINGKKHKHIFVCSNSNCNADFCKHKNKFCLECLMKEKDWNKALGRKV